MNDRDASDVMAVLVVATPGWTDDVVDAVLGMVADRWNDPAAAHIAVQQVADTWTGYGRPPWGTLHTAYQAVVRRAALARPTLPPAPSRTVTIAEGRRIAARAYAANCATRNPDTDPHIRSGFRTTEPNPDFLDRLLGLRPAWTDDP